MRRFLLIGTLVAVFAIVALRIADRDQEHTANFFASSLASHKVSENVFIDGEEYYVERGTVVRAGRVVTGPDAYRPLALAYEKAAARRSPLASLPNVDIDSLRVQIRDLQRTAVDLASLQQRDRESTLVSGSLYPSDMLLNLAESEDARRHFLSAGTDNAAKAYERAQLKFTETYRRDAARFRRAFEELVPASAPTYATERSLVSRDELLAAIDSLALGVASTEKKILARSSCVRGMVRACDPSELSLPPIPIAGPTHLEDQSVALAADVRALLTSSGAAFAQKPLFALDSSACIRSGPGSALLFAFKFDTVPDGSLASSTSPTYVGDIHLIRSDRFADKPFYEFFADRGIPYVNTNPLTYYGCLETDTDQAALIAMRDIHAFATAAHLSTAAPAQERSALETLETKIAPDDIVSMQDITAYMRAAQDLATYGLLPPTVVSSLNDLQLALAYGSAGITAVIPDVARREYTDMYIARTYGVSRDFGAKYLFFARSAVLPLFLASNISATGEHGKLLRDNTLGGDALPYTYYSSLSRSPLEKAAVLRSETYFRTLHNNI